jgi:hypothetical protein
MREDEIERAIASDPDEAGIVWEWDHAEVVIAKAKEQINLRVDVLDFFKSQV